MYTLTYLRGPIWLMPPMPISFYYVICQHVATRIGCDGGRHSRVIGAGGSFFSLSRQKLELLQFIHECNYTRNKWQ